MSHETAPQKIKGGKKKDGHGERRVSTRRSRAIRVRRRAASAVGGQMFDSEDRS